jgi:uncharacterized RDD family membrane protein YckC
VNNKLGLETPRVLASVIDGVAMVVIMAVIRLILGHGWFGNVIAIAAGLGYMFIEVMNGASAGKKMMKVGILSEGGGAPSQDQLLKRYFVKMAGWLIYFAGAIIIVIPVLGWIIGLLLYFASAVVGLGLGLVSLYKIMQPEKRALWDEMAGTAVYLVGDSVVAPSYPQPPPPQFPGPDPAPVAPPPPPPVSAPEL